MMHSAPDSTQDDSARASSSSTPRSSTTSSARPTALLTKSWTSATSTASSSRITVGANTSTAADASSSTSQTASHTSSASTRTSTPIPELSFSPSTPQLSGNDGPFGVSHSSSQSMALQGSTHSSTSQSRSNDGDQSSDGAFNDAVEDEPESLGMTTSSSIHALDLLQRVNDKAAADRATQHSTLRSRLSQLSISRGSSKNRSRSSSRDASRDRALPDESVGSTRADPACKSPPILAEHAEESHIANASSISSTPTSEQYADRKYYILSSAGKPIYISHASLSRRRRRRDQRRRQRSPPTPDTNTRNESDEEDESSTTQVGVMQALISIFADEDSDKLRFIRQGDLLITFLLRSPLYLVCVSSWNEEPSTLRQHLEYLYLQVISLVSGSQLSRLFGRMPNFDLRRLLEGTEGIFDFLVGQLNANELEEEEGEGKTDWASCHQWWLQALQPIRVTLPNLRDQLTAALQPPAAESSLPPHRPKDLLYVLLVANGRIVTLLRPRKHSVHPIDLLLLTNTVMGSRSIKKAGGSEEAEIWMPFSMPKFAPQGFVHAYVKFLDPESWTGSASRHGAGKMGSSELAVIVVTGDKDAFPTVSTWISSLLAKPPSSTTDGAHAVSIKSTSKVQKAAQKVRSASKTLKPASSGSEAAPWMTTFQGYILTLSRHLSDPTNVEEGSPRVSAYTCAELALPGLRHFVYRSNSTIQLTSPTLPSPYSHSSRDRKRLFTLYSLVHHHIHHPTPPSPSTSADSDPIAPSNPTTPNLESSSAPSQLASALGFATTWNTPTRPLLTADRRLKMQLVKTQHEQVLGWITAPFELYLCVNPSLSKTSIVAVANGLTKWIKHNEKDLFLVNAGSF